MNILIACDKFKNSLSASEVCDALANGIKQSHPTAKIIKCPMADGGDGTIQLLQDTLDLKRVDIKSVDPLGRAIDTHYSIAPDIAYIELAEASGIARLQHDELDPLNAHAFGTGQIIQHAISHGIRKIVLGIGGSASTECGLSIAYSMGWSFLDDQGQSIIPTGGNLMDIIAIEPPTEKPEIELTVLCDVDNPLYGTNGAAYIYGPQKGASKSQVALLDSGLRHIASLIKTTTGVDISSLRGGGAAGGVAAGLYGLMDAQVVSGFDYLSSLLHLDHQIIRADLIITGEGRLDEQSLSGKVVGSIAELCLQYNKPLYAVVGENRLSSEQLESLGINKVYPIIELAVDLEDSMRNVEEYLGDVRISIKT